MALGASTWRCGHITKIDKDARLLTVKMQKASDEEMRGYHFIKEAGKNCFLNDYAATYSETFSKWLKQNEAERTYRFIVDNATEIFLNGNEGKAQDLKVGDFVGIEYEAIDDGKEEIYSVHVRAKRFGGEAGSANKPSGTRE